MKNIFLLVLEVFLFVSTSFSQKLSSSEIKTEWLTPLLISETNFSQYNTPAMSILSADHIIFSFIQSPYRSPDYRNKNVYIKELKNGVLSDSINLTKNIYYSNWPIIKTDRKGITHLIWGYSPVAPNTIRPSISTDVYYSFNYNNIWSNPISIYHKESIDGENSYANGKLRLDSKNRLHLLWQATFSSGFHFYHKVEENCVWSETEELPFISADYDYMFDKNDRLHMVYLRPVIDTGPDVNSVFYRYSDDYGKTWSDSVLVHRSFTLRALNVQILVDKQNTIHILWTKHLSGSVNAAEAIYHSYSTDGGQWISPNRAVLTNEDAILYFSAAIDKNDRIHLVYDQWSSLFTPPVKLSYTFWDGINWSIPFALFNNSQMPLIEIDSLNYLHLVYASEAGGYKYYTRTANPLITNVDVEKNNIPDEYDLLQNYPNPFNPVTNISYKLPKGCFVTLKIFNSLGKELTTLVNEYQEAGEYQTQFSILNSQLSSGVYFYNLRAGTYSETKKLVLLK